MSARHKKETACHLITQVTHLEPLQGDGGWERERVDPVSKREEDEPCQGGG